MTARSLGRWLLVLAAALVFRAAGHAQDPGPPPPLPPASQPAADTPAPPKGVEVLARGPVHEAFATPLTEPEPTKPVLKQPPKPLDEMPPDQKPEGDSVWIGGYWAWDDDRNDFLWVSGIWRTPPPGRTWVAGYWREDAGQWQWVPGFWSQASGEGTTQQVTYLPAPPQPPQVAPPGAPPSEETFYVPGAWAWDGEHYVWRAGYWARVQPGYVWVAAHYVWTPSGYVYVPGYWDLAVAHRGVLYAPVVIDPVVVGVGFVYTPAYVVSDTIMVDALFVRPCYHHYYFGDYYGPTYVSLGFESCVVYSNRCYDPIFVYARWEHRDEPRWARVQLDVTLARHAGQAPLPPRTLVQQNIIVNRTTIVNNTTVVNRNQVLMPASQLASARGTRMVSLDTTTRTQIRSQAGAFQQTSIQRSRTELSVPGGAPQRPRAATLNVSPAFNRTASLGQGQQGIGGSPGQRNFSSTSTFPGYPGTAGAAPPPLGTHYPGPANTLHSTASPLGGPPRPGMPLNRPYPPRPGTTPSRPAPARPESHEKRPDHEGH